MKGTNCIIENLLESESLHQIRIYSKNFILSPKKETEMGLIPKELIPKERISATKVTAVRYQKATKR